MRSRKADSLRKIRHKIDKHIRQWSQEFGSIHLDLDVMSEDSMSLTSWAKARLHHIARKTQTSSQSVLEVAAACVLEYQQNENNSEDSMEELSISEHPGDHKDDAPV